MVVMRQNPSSVAWKEVDWNGGVRDDQVKHDDQAQGGQDQVGDEPLAVSPRSCNPELRRRARSAPKRSEKNDATNRVTRSLLLPHTFPQHWAALHRFFAQRRGVVSHGQQMRGTESECWWVTL